MVLIAAAGAAVAAEDDSGSGGDGESPSVGSELDRRWALGDDDDLRAFAFTPYRPNYILPLSYRSEPGSGVDGEADRLELAFQISFKTRLWSDLLLKDGALWFGYTQKSFWQAYSTSSPFRETNYEPELRYAYELDGSLGSWGPRLVTVGLNHQSNGRSGPDSRSWNRLTAALFFERGPFSLETRGWTRLPDYGSGDDNPGIVDRIGRGEIEGRYEVGGHSLSAYVRSNFEPDDPKSAVRATYAFPLNRAFRGYIRVFHGYGDSLIDFDEVATRVGVGIALARW